MSLKLSFTKFRKCGRPIECFKSFACETQWKYLLYDKSVVKPNPKAKRGRFNHGVAVSDQLEGPNEHHPKRVTRRAMAHLRCPHASIAG